MDKFTKNCAEQIKTFLATKIIFIQWFFWHLWLTFIIQFSNCDTMTHKLQFWGVQLHQMGSVLSLYSWWTHDITQYMQQLTSPCGPCSCKIVVLLFSLVFFGSIIKSWQQEFVARRSTVFFITCVMAWTFVHSIMCDWLSFSSGSIQHLIFCVLILW